jgi:hypothetical protein
MPTPATPNSPPAPADAAPAFGFGTPFAEQIDFFRRKLNLPTDWWDDIERNAHDRAFIVAGAAKADLLQDLRNAVGQRMQAGASTAQFTKDFEAIVTQHGWAGFTGDGSAAGRAWRARIIYETNMASSYAAGRYRQLTDPAFARIRPFWRYVHAEGVTHPRPLHMAWNGTTLPKDHPFWQTHFAPNGWGCLCEVRPVKAPEPGDKTAPPEGWDTIDPKTGAPLGIDKGWDYAPGASATASLQSLIDQKLIKLDAPLGAAMWQALKAPLLAEQTQAFAAWADTLTQATGEVKQVGALSPEVVAKLAARGAEPASSALAVRDVDVLHAQRDSKDDRIPWDWFRQLPSQLADPQAVLWDKSDPSGAILMIFDVAGQTGKLVVKINYQISQRGADGVKRQTTANIVRSGKLMAPQALADARTYELLQGKL